MKPIFFVGEHSTVMINLREVTFATGGPCNNDNVFVHFKNGASLTLSNQNANMFRKAWREYAGDNIPDTE